MPEGSLAPAFYATGATSDALSLFRNAKVGLAALMSLRYHDSSVGHIVSPSAGQSKLKDVVLSAHEESLISVVRALRPAEAGKVLDWVRQLADLAGERTIEWSDSWTDEDLADATTAALRRFEDQEREGC